MMRRKLLVYTSLFIAGITAGYFICERIRLISGIGFLCISGSAIALYGRRSERKENTTERSICALMLFLGFVIICMNYAYYEGAVLSDDLIRGRVVSTEDKGEYLNLIIVTEKEGMRIMLQTGREYPEHTDTIRYIGAVIEAKGEIKELRKADNPGCFDYKIYMRSRGICLEYKAEYIQILKEPDEPVWRMRRRLLAARERFLSEMNIDSRGFLRGVLFGDKSEIDEEVLKEFNLNSSGHILAVSGLHIGFLYGLLRILSGMRRTMSASIAIIIVLLLYCEMTMWSSSVIRAFTVLSIRILSVNLKRPFDLLTSLAASAFIILIGRPYMLFNAGFQMSFAAMGSITFLGEHMRRLFGDYMAAAISLQIGTIPLIACIFYRYNLLAPLINIPIITLSSVLVPICILTLLAVIIFDFVPGFAVICIDFISKSLLLINHKLSFKGSFTFLASGIGSSHVILFYFAVCLLSSEWFRVNIIRKKYSEIKKLTSIILASLIMICFALYNPLSSDEIIFVSVGQGDCTHIRCDDTDIIIDGGGSDYVNVGERTLMPYLLSQSASDVDLGIVTHLHKDHYLGMAELSQVYPVKAVAIPMDYKDYYEHLNSAYKNAEDFESPEAKGFKTDRIIYLNQSSVIEISDELRIEVIWPDRLNSTSVDINDANEHNMVYMVYYKGVKIMVTGDLLEADELKMVNAYKGSDKLKCDILKVAHHGSMSSSSEAFLDAASPEIAVIQAGRNNIYGHPHNQTLDRLNKRGIEVYRNDIHGAVGIDILDSRKFKVHTMHRFE